MPGTHDDRPRSDQDGLLRSTVRAGFAESGADVVYDGLLGVAGVRLSSFVGTHTRGLHDTLLEHGRDDGVEPAPPGLPPMLLGSWGANVERAARKFDGWLASGYRSTPDEICAAHDRFRAAGGRRAIVCAIPVRSTDDLPPTRSALARYAAAGFDDAVVLFEPGGPRPAQVRELYP